jgi:hypothetical protein
MTHEGPDQERSTPEARAVTNPFPGMDPYIESFGNWEDFHNRLIAEICNSLGPTLPAQYFAESQERVEVVSYVEDWTVAYKPDVLIARDPEVAAGPGAGRSEATAGRGPITLDVEPLPTDEVHHTWVEIRAMPDLELVTVIEVLSKTNKVGEGHLIYQSKRRKLKAAGVHLVEIDLLLGGHRVLSRGLPAGDYYAIVARADRRPRGDVYSWTIRDPLPTLPIPLRGDDPDAHIDLGPLVNRVYDTGRYALRLRRRPPLPESAPLHPDDREWAEAVARSSVGR